MSKQSQPQQHQQSHPTAHKASLPIQRKRSRRRRRCLFVPLSSVSSSSSSSSSASSTPPSPTFPCCVPSLTRVRRERGQGDIPRKKRIVGASTVITSAPVPEVSEGQRRYILAIPPTHSSSTSTGLATCTSTCSSSEDVSPQPITSCISVSPPSAVQFEATRLDRQHAYYKHASDDYLLHPLLYPLTTPHRQFNRIMDVGCGTGIWMMDYLTQCHGGATVHGCDINLSTVKPQLRPYCIDHDVLQPFPIGSTVDIGRQGSYDLVHCRLLIYALQKGVGWKVAVQNMVRLLRPNGILHLSELNAVAHLPPGSNLIHESSNPILRINSIATLTLTSLQKDQYAGTNLQSHLAGAGLSTSSVKKITIPFGKLARDKGYHPLFVEHGIRCALKAIQVLKVPYLAAGGLTWEEGGVGKTSWAFDAWLVDLEKAIREKGMLYEFFMCYGRRVEE